MCERSMLEQVLFLLDRSPHHRRYAVDTVLRCIVPPLDLGQWAGIEWDGRLVAWASWAWLPPAKAVMARGGATKAEQVRNVERYTALKDKHAAAQDKAIAKANAAAAKARRSSWSFIGGRTGLDNPKGFTAEQRQGQLRANQAAAQTRSRVKNYLDVMADPKTRPLGLTPADVRKTAWVLVGRDVGTGMSEAVGIGHGIHFPDLPQTAPQAESSFVRDAVGVSGINIFNDVLEVQKTLAAKGYMANDHITGYIGTKTVEAIKDMQKAEGRPVTGTIRPEDAVPGDNPNAEGSVQGLVRTAADAVLLGDGDVVAGLVGAGYGLGRQLLDGNVGQAWDTAGGMYDAMADDHKMRVQEFAAQNPKTTLALKAAGAVPAAVATTKAGVQLGVGAARTATPAVRHGVTGIRNLLDDSLDHAIEFSGREYWIGDKLRVAPLGNRRGHPIGKYPHYHHAVPHPKRSGVSKPDQGIKRHRPWETKRPDKSWKDRF